MIYTVGRVSNLSYRMNHSRTIKKTVTDLNRPLFSKILNINHLRHRSNRFHRTHRRT
jgi:hypothetical protein